MNNYKPVILCIDDEKVVLQSIKSQLKDFLTTKYRIETAENGENALEVVDEILQEGKEIPLVIVDYLMPAMKGDKVLIHIHDRSPKTLCIMLTGQADLSAVANAVNHEALFRFMSKPWNKEDLIITIQEAVHRYDLEKNLAQKQILLEKQNIDLENLNKKLKEKIELFYRFVPIEFLKSLNIDPTRDYIELGESQQKEVTVLFADIRSFTDRTQNLTSAETFEFINSFTQLISPIIKKNEGFIDKFIGDGILCVFFNVNNCLNGIFEILQVFRQSTNAKLSNLKIGFSAHYGLVQMGTVGYSGRMETTILGKTVNIAAKMEKLNKMYETTIIVTEEITKLADKEIFSFSLLDTTYLPGITEPVVLYTVSLRPIAI